MKLHFVNPYILVIYEKQLMSAKYYGHLYADLRR